MNSSKSQKPTNLALGRKNEELAADYLISNGYEVLHRNYFYNKKEIDIIALFGKTLVFVEVKYRKNEKFGFPEEWVDEAKMQRIFEAAENYIYENKWQGNVRYDIVAIMGQGDVKHFIDAIN